jgi:hypothetical protein
MAQVVEHQTLSSNPNTILLTWDSVQRLNFWAQGAAK